MLFNVIFFSVFDTIQNNRFSNDIFNEGFETLNIIKNNYISFINLAYFKYSICLFFTLFPNIYSTRTTDVLHTIFHDGYKEFILSAWGYAKFLKNMHKTHILGSYVKASHMVLNQNMLEILAMEIIFG